MFFSLFDGIPVIFHLFWEIGFQHLIFADTFLNEVHGVLTADFYGWFTLFPVVEPGFRPPPYAGPVGIDCYQARNVETLQFYLQSGERINDAACGYGPVKTFFLSLSLHVDRNILCRRAR